MDKWTVWHRFNSLIKADKVNPIKCPDCDIRMITRVKGTIDDEPYLWCYQCDTFIKPGLDVYDRVRAVVSEHYI